MRRDRGSASLELVLMTPPLVLLLLFVVFVGRLAEARADVDRAARDGARAASMARDPASAETAGLAAADATLESGGVSCRELQVSVDTDSFSPGSTVAVTVTCTIEIADLALLRVPGARLLSATFVEPVDAFTGGAAG